MILNIQIKQLEKLMKQMDNEEVVIVTWGFGPTYRERIKYQIDESSKIGYNRIMKYFILTDKVEDFTGLDKNIQDLIVGVVDIEELRKDDEFSKKYEPLPEEKDNDELYAKQLRYNSDEKKLLLSYGLKRYVFKALAERNITKFLYMDSDIQLFYEHIVSGRLSEEEFWGHFDIPLNCIKGCGSEKLYFTGMDANQKIDFVWSKTAGAHDSVRALQACSIVANQYYNEVGQPQKFEILTELPILEGPVRLYNFEHSEKLLQYFNTLNHIYRLFLETPQLYNTNLCGGYILCDYLPLSLVNLIENISNEHFPGYVFQFRVFYEDRFWGVPWHFDPDCNGKELYLISAKNKTEFLEINTELINCMRGKKQWPFSFYSTQ